MGFEILGQVGSVSLLVQSSVFLRKIPLIYVASIYCTFAATFSPIFYSHVLFDSHLRSLGSNICSCN